MTETTTPCPMKRVKLYNYVANEYALRIHKIYTNHACQAMLCTSSCSFKCHITTKYRVDGVNEA